MVVSDSFFWTSVAAGAVLLAVALYFAAQETLVEFKYRVTINCKPQRAFQFLKDPSNIKKLKTFMEDVQISELHKREDGIEYNKFIATDSLHLPFGFSRTMRYQVEWTSYDNNQTISFSFTSNALVRGVGSFVVQPGAEENTSEVVDATRLYTFKIMHRFVGKQLNHAHTGQLDALKKVLEELS